MEPSEECSVLAAQASRKSAEDFLSSAEFASKVRVFSGGESYSSEQKSHTATHNNLKGPAFYQGKHHENRGGAQHRKVARYSAGQANESRADQSDPSHRR